MSEASKLYKTPGKNSPKMPLKRAILMAPNGWISVCLGLIWAGYIQDGLVPFGPTEIAPGEPWGGQKSGTPHYHPKYHYYQNDHYYSKDRYYQKGLNI